MKHKKFLGAAGAALMIVITILTLTSGAWAQSKFKTLYKFTGGQDGNENANLFSTGVVFDAVGNLYGATAGGGSHGNGVIFKLALSADGRWTQSVLYNFTGGTDGGTPLASLIFDGAGNLYGTTSSGGVNGRGTVFTLIPNTDGSWTESVLYSFTGGGDGGEPQTALILDPGGNLYGTTNSGGRGYGVVFKLAPNLDGTWTESVLHAFTAGNDGWGQISSLVFDKAGNLYGTAQGGKYGQGVIFELTPSAGYWKETILYTFTHHQDGSDPFSFAGLVFDAAGDLYGTTFWGANFGAGTVFKLTPTSSGPWKWSLLHSFGTENAYHPFAGVIFDAAGNLYGTTPSGGSIGCGIVFELTPTSSDGWKERVLHNFVDRPGCIGWPGLVIDRAGNLYGVTTGDGSKTFGSVFEITP
jgi:uncharacterized repeat protein (TIGR03803 family)